MFTVLRALVQTAFFLVLLTIVGQVRIGEHSLEQRYHRSVNSDKFQNFFWTTVRPVTWTWEKVQDLTRERKESLVR